MNNAQVPPFHQSYSNGTPGLAPKISVNASGKEKVLAEILVDKMSLLRKSYEAELLDKDSYDKYQNT